VVLPVQSLGCCSTWTFCQDRNGRDLPFGSWFLSCPGRSSHSPAEAIIAFFFEYLLIFLVKYFLLVYANTNYFTLISSVPILVGIRAPKSTRRLTDEGRGFPYLFGWSFSCADKIEEGHFSSIVGTVSLDNRKRSDCDTSISSPKKDAKQPCCFYIPDLPKRLFPSSHDSRFPLLLKGFSRIFSCRIERLLSAGYPFVPNDLFPKLLMRSKAAFSERLFLCPKGLGHMLSTGSDGSFNRYINGSIRGFLTHLFCGFFPCRFDG